jgi:type III pantothenate kinase
VFIDMVLQIDIGNSRIKWRLMNGRKVSVVGSQATATILSGKPLDLKGVNSVSEVQTASVANPVVITSLRHQLAERFSVSIKIAQVTAKAAGVTCGYKNPQQLGVDRWLAIVAAYHQFPERLLVVDAGSAITLDLVSPEGQHQGGYIIPGLRLMNEALQKGTEAIDVKSSDTSDILNPGEDSQQAVNKGCLMAAVAAVEKLVSEQPTRVVVTGGDAEVLLNGLSSTSDRVDNDLIKPKFTITHCPDLVLDGLSIPGISLVNSDL